MILDFRNYRMRAGHATPHDMLIYPGLQLSVRRDGNKVIISDPVSGAQFPSEVELYDLETAKRLFKDIDMFLQYRSHELPEYRL